MSPPTSRTSAIATPLAALSPSPVHSPLRFIRFAGRAVINACTYSFVINVVTYGKWNGHFIHLIGPLVAITHSARGRYCYSRTNEILFSSIFSAFVSISYAFSRVPPAVLSPLESAERGARNFALRNYKSCSAAGSARLRRVPLAVAGHWPHVFLCARFSSVRVAES